MITEVPTPTPVTVPDVGKTVATPIFPLFQVPPVVASASVVVAPLQIFKDPVIGEMALTLTINVAVQPLTE